LLQISNITRMPEVRNVFFTHPLSATACLLHTHSHTQDIVLLFCSGRFNRFTGLERSTTKVYHKDVLGYFKKLEKHGKLPKLIIKGVTDLHGKHPNHVFGTNEKETQERSTSDSDDQGQGDASYSE
jgi:hypothetical protein